MKTDTTSGPLILSRKIRALHYSTISSYLLGLMLIWPTVIWAQNRLLVTPENIISIPKNRAVIIDTRSKFKYLLGHIPNAIHLGQWENFTQKINGIRGLLVEDRRYIADKLNSYGINHDKTIVIYGEPTDPWRTDGRFFWMFERFGFKKVSILEGGLDNWKKTGGELEFGESKLENTSSITIEDITFNEQVIADQQWIVSRLGSKNFIIIDNRTLKEYEGDQPYGSARGGHIPTAIHIHWPKLFTNKGYMRNKNDLRKLLKQYGIIPEMEIVVYCTGGVRSAMAYFVFRYLGYQVRNYDGSWWDWSLNPDLPVETI